MRIDCRSPFPVAFGLLLIVGEGGNSRGGTISAGLPFPRLFRPGRQLTGVEAVVGDHNAPSFFWPLMRARVTTPAPNQNPTNELEKWAGSIQRS